MDLFRRLRLGLATLVAVIVAGVVGYVALGFGVLDALYQTITTITTVGFREVEPLSSVGKVFTMVLILLGVGTALYTFGALLEAVVEGHVRNLLWRRRMSKTIDAMDGHVIICGWGRVGRAIAGFVGNRGHDVVVVDRDPTRVQAVGHPTIEGDVTDDEVLKAAGIDRARVLVAALDTDSDNVYVTLSGRSLNPGLVIVARARNEASEAKLRRAGADHVVNPQRLGGDRMAAFALQPHVVDFLDLVMHDGTLEFHLEEVTVADRSPLSGTTLRESHVRDRTGAMVLAVRDLDGTFMTNPDPATPLLTGHILICIGTRPQLAALADLARPTS